MIQVTTNAGQVANMFGLIKVNIPDKVVPKVIKEGVNKGVARAKSMSPVFTGALKAGITGLANKKQGLILSGVPKKFPYQFWVNEQPGFETVRMVRKGGVPMRYNQTRMTGVPKYFTIMTNELPVWMLKRSQELVGQELQKRKVK